MKAIYKKELRAYFSNMTGYVFIAFLLFFTGVFSYAINFRNAYPNFERVLSNISFIFLLAVPVLTMRSLAEEKQQKTDQLLYSLPIGVTKTVLGKYLAMVTVLLIPTLVMCLYPIVLSFFGQVNFSEAYTAIVGFMLLGCTLTAIGMFISSLTESQVIAAVITFGVMLVFYLMSTLATLIPATSIASLIAFMIVIVMFAVIVYFMLKDIYIALIFGMLGEFILVLVYVKFQTAFEGAFASVLNWLSVYDRLENFMYGLFDVGAVIYYFSLIGLFIFLCVQSMEKKRWS